MLRLEIDGRWEPVDFIEVLTGIESLYYKAALIRRYRFPYEPPFYRFERPELSASFDDHFATPMIGFLPVRERQPTPNIG